MIIIIIYPRRLYSRRRGYNVQSCLFVRALHGKRLELSTPNFVHVYSIAVARHALTHRLKGRRSRSHGYQNRHGRTVATDVLLQPCAAAAVGVGLHVDTTVYVFYFVEMYWFLADVNLRSRSLYAIAIPSVVCLSVVCDVGAPYSAGWNFQQFYFTIRKPRDSSFLMTKIVGGGHPFAPEICVQSDSPPFKQRNFDQYRLIAPQPW